MGLKMYRGNGFMYTNALYYACDRVNSNGKVYAKDKMHVFVSRRLSLEPLSMPYRAILPRNITLVDVVLDCCYFQQRYNYDCYYCLC